MAFAGGGSGEPFDFGDFGGFVSNLVSQSVQVFQAMYWFEPVLKLACKQSFVVAALLLAFGSFGGPVSSLQLQAVHVLHEMYWLDPARTLSCGQAICSAVAFGGGGGTATAFAFATAFATGAAAAAAAADFVGAAFKVACGLAKGVAR